MSVLMLTLMPIQTNVSERSNALVGPVRGGKYSKLSLVWKFLLSYIVIVGNKYNSMLF